MRELLFDLTVMLISNFESWVTPLANQLIFRTNIAHMNGYETLIGMAIRIPTVKSGFSHCYVTVGNRRQQRFSHNADTAE